MGIKQASLLLIVFVLMAFGLPKNIQKKIDKEIKSVYGLETFVFTPKAIPADIAKDLPATFGKDNFFKIESNQQLLGYAYLAKAPSKTAQFDYLVLLDTALVVKKAKVLVYREEYGGEIGSKRWLRQFIGKTQHDQLKYADNIIAISGATISVRSMTSAVNNLLKSLKVLHSKNIL